MHNEKIFDWIAKRAGGRITITGSKADGTAIKVVGVDKIEGATMSGDPIATDKDGVKYKLA